MNPLKLIIRTLQTVSAAFYLYFIVDFVIAPYDDDETLLGNIMVYVLFSLFIAGYILVWKNFKISGIILISWYLILLALVEWVWQHGGMAIIIGAPIFILGIITFLYGLVRKE